MLSVLVVEDAANIRAQLVRLFEKRWSCYEVKAVAGCREARAALRAGRINLALLDLGLPSEAKGTDADWHNGRDLLRFVRRDFPHVKTIILSTHGELVRDFLKEEGADDFFLKDRREDWLGDKLPSQVERLIGHLGCRSAAGKRLRQALAEVGNEVPVVVIEGERGAGKKHAAQLLHLNSTRADRKLLELSSRHLRPETFLADMVGEEGAAPVAGLLEGDTTGTIVIDGLEGLTRADPLVQSVLAELLGSARDGALRYTPLGGSQVRVSPCRLTLCVSGQLADLLDGAGLLAELSRELRQLPLLSVPASRERAEDVPETVEAIRRQCNEGRRDSPTTGTEASAADLLTAALGEGRLGSLADLEAVVRAACRIADGQRLTASEVERALPTTRGREQEPSPRRAPHVSREVALDAYRQVERGFADSEDTAERMQHLDRLAALGEMVSGVVHELGTPMTSILAAANTMGALGDELTAEQTAEMTQILCEESQRMRQMIEDLRHFSRRGEGDERQETDLEELVAAAVKLVRLDAKAKHLRMVVQTTTAIDPLPAYSDRLKQVFLNLLRNAVEAVDAETGALEITLSQAGESVTLALADNGCGMPPEVRDRVFEPFFTTKGEGGTGIGLDISRKIVEAHGGAITVESAPGEGTTFTIELPRAP